VVKTDHIQHGGAVVIGSCPTWQWEYPTRAVMVVGSIIYGDAVVYVARTDHILYDGAVVAGCSAMIVGPILAPHLRKAFGAK